VTGLSGSVVGARLRLYVDDGSPDGGAVYRVSSDWSESTITWSNAPALPISSLGSYGEVANGTWVELDVAPAVIGNGVYAFGIASTSTNSVYWSSKEGANPPQLLIEVQGTPPPPPAAAFTADPTSGTAPLTVAFTDVSSGHPTSWAWDFQSDGSIDSTARDPVFTFTSAGTYDVTLTVGNAGGYDSLTMASLVTVAVPPPPDPDASTIVGAGDIATCSSTRDEATAALIDGIPGTVVTLGDNVYPNGTAAEFTDCYEPSWGRFKARTRPSVGNSDYGTSGASGYFGYFGAAAGDATRGYYSYDLGSWHVIVLNSNCAEVGGCGTGSAQEQWLRADLAASANACTLAYWHHPRWSSAGGATGSVGAFWDALYEHGVEVVLNGHAHVYERFAPQTPAGVRDPSGGIRQFTVGTGGESLAAWGTIQSTSQLRQNTTDGVLALSLTNQGYGWSYIPVSGTFADSGFEYCH
jgi:PKD repeat protein